MAERVAIVGVAQTNFAPRRADVNYAEMAYEVIKKVMTDARLESCRNI